MTVEKSRRSRWAIRDYNDTSPMDRQELRRELARENKRLKQQIEFLEARLEAFENPPVVPGQQGPVKASAGLAHRLRIV